MVSLLKIFYYLKIFLNQLDIDDDVCDINEEYSRCGTQCQRTCADVNKLEKPCSHMCITGCFCIDGYVRKKDANSECIKETKC